MSRRRIARQYPGPGPLAVATLRHEPGRWRIIRPSISRWREMPPCRTYPSRPAAWTAAHHLARSLAER
jgi:hypothetical protein